MRPWFALFMTAAPLLASTSIVRLDTTPQQAIVTVNTDQSGNCTYHASRGNTLLGDIADLNDNGNTDARPGSIVNGNTRKFVLGARHGNYSLAAGATYTIGVTCGNDSQVSKTFQTRPIPWDATYPLTVPFNPARFGNMDYPLINWSDPSQSYIDPMTGAETWRISSVGILNQGTQRNNRVALADDLSGGQWTGVENAGTGSNCSKGLCAHAAGGPTDKMFVPMAPTNCSGGGNFSGFRHAGNPCIIDDVLVDVFCGNASASGVSLTLQWSLDHGKTVVGNRILTAACPSGTPAKIGTYPNAKPQPIWKGWGFTPARYNIWPMAGKADISNSVMNATQGAFWTTGEMGPRILINGAYYDIAGVDSPVRLRLAQDLSASGANWQSAASGLVITKNGPQGSTVDASININISYTESVDAGLNGDPSLFNWNPVSVTKTADGTALDTPLTGYFGAFNAISGALQVFLWVPYNADGSVRNEVRALSRACVNSKLPSFHANGDAFGSCAYLSTGAQSVFGSSDGKSFYTHDIGSKHLFRVTYNEKRPGCDGFPAYHADPASGDYPTNAAGDADCFDYENITPTAAHADLQQQVISAYQTGKNIKGETVGPPHPGFDLGWMSAFSIDLTSGGLMIGHMMNGHEHLGIIASFDLNTGVLKWVRDTWSGPTSTSGTAPSVAGPGRWGGFHSCSYSFETWVWCADNPIGDGGNAVPFASAFTMPVVAINRSGSGHDAAWDCKTCGGAHQSTALARDEAYTCPAADQLLPDYAAFAGTQNCVQVRVSQPPCDVYPNSTYVFSDGKTEKDEFPCTTPGFGVANANASKLQDLLQGDWLYVQATGRNVERFVVLTAPSYNATNDITFWVLRWAKHNLWLPIWNNPNDDDKSYAPALGDGWSLEAAPFYGSSLTVDASGNNDWVRDNPMHSACHGVIGNGTVKGTATWVSIGCYGNVGSFDLPPAQLTMAPVQTFGQNPLTFAGAKGDTYVQSYPSLSYGPGAAKVPFVADFRHVNPPTGNGPEFTGQSIGATNIALVPGTSKSYKLAEPTGAPLNYKLLPYHGWAGRFLLKDISGPTTGNTADLPDYTFCVALNADECFKGSKPGNLYAAVPGAFVQNGCWTDQLTFPVPCVIQLSPVTGTAMQLRIDNYAGPGLRRFGMNHGMPGTQYEFSNCRISPDANFLICFGNWLDGVRNDWLAIHLQPTPQPDGVPRNTFIPMNIPVNGVSWAANVRARFGYAENGNVAFGQLRCTPYAQDCSTEIPSSHGTDPYSFTSEQVERQKCPNGSTCNVEIPAISGRVLYYVIDRLDRNGNVVSTTPMDSLAVP